MHVEAFWNSDVQEINRSKIWPKSSTVQGIIFYGGTENSPVLMSRNSKISKFILIKTLPSIIFLVSSLFLGFYLCEVKII